MTKVWLVTGSAHGLGRSIVEAALDAGDKVVATARKLEALAELTARYGDAIATFALDVTDSKGAQAAVAFAQETYGRLDVLVNNAGYGHVAAFEQVDEADFRAQIETNFFGVVNLARAALPVMRHQRSGHIINVSSIGGRLGTSGLSAYQAAKWAVGGFTEVLAKEAASFGVKVIALEPGGMRTDWAFVAKGSAAGVWPDYEPSVGAMLAMTSAYAGNEIGDPAKVAALVVDLAGHDTLPAHLVLGSDALHVLAQAEAERQADASAWAAVSRSTDFEGSSFSMVGELK